MLETLSEQVIFTAGEGYTEYRIPGILPTENGAALLVCEARAETLNDWGDIDIIVTKRDKDGTCREVLKIGDSDKPKDGTMHTYNNPTLIPDGENIHIIYHRNYERAFIITSSDGGETWSEAREITDAYRGFRYAWNVCATGPGHGIRMKNGRLIAPVWLANGEVRGQVRGHQPSAAGCLFSDDHGSTWYAGAIAEGINDGNETTVAQLPDGRLLFNIRNNEDEKCRILALSEDGESFTRIFPAHSLIDPRCFGSMTEFGEKVLFANCADTGSRVSLTVKSTEDAGETWRYVWKVDEMGGYIDIGMKDGLVYAFFERCDIEKGITCELVLKTARE